MLVLYVGLGVAAGALIGSMIWNLGHEVRFVRRNSARSGDAML
jgi:hypothetical protein